MTNDFKAAPMTMDAVPRTQPKTLNYRPAILDPAVPPATEVKPAGAPKLAEPTWSAPKPTGAESSSRLSNDAKLSQSKGVTTVDAVSKTGSKASDAKPVSLDGPAPAPKDGKAGDSKEPPPLSSDVKAAAPPGSVLLPGGSAASGCSTCTKSCDSCGGGRGWSGGKVRAWLSYHPHCTPLSECAADYREPDIYTFFLDVPCRQTWKPVQCLDKPCGKCGACDRVANGSPNGTEPVPTSSSELLPAPRETLAPQPSPRKPGFATDR
jgi:hypothetical protein